MPTKSHAAKRSATMLKAYCLGMALAWPALAQDPASDSATSEIGILENDITHSTSKQADIIRELTVSLKAKEEASSRLVALAETVSTQEQELALITQRMEKLSSDNAAALLDLATKREALGTLLAGLQKLSKNPPPALAVSPSDVTAALRGAMLFAAVIPELRKEADAVKQALARVDAIRQELTLEKQKSADALAALVATRTSIATSIAARQAAAIASTKALTTERAKAKALADRAKNLRELVAGLQRQREADAAELEEIIRTAPDFADLKGKLNPPVAGPVVSQFGDLKTEGSKLQGQRLATTEGAQVLSPVSGRIEFAGEYLNYGKLVIVNPGRNHLILLAGLRSISVELGQSVRSGEPLGDMGSDNVTNSSLTNRIIPVLYVEFRKRNEPIDPSPWWKNSGQDRQAKVGTQ